MPALQYDPNDPAIRQNPFPLFRRLQDEDPVHWSHSISSWVLTRYDDVRQVQLDSNISADRLSPFYESLPAERRGVLE